MPGTPTASKATRGRRPSTRRQASTTPSSVGSTASTAPMVSAMARRFGDRSAATIDSTPMARKRGDDGQPDRPASHHHGAVAVGGTRAGHAVDAHRQGLGERGVAGVEPVGDLEGERCGQEHVLGVPTRIGVVVGQLVQAGRREQHRDRHHPGPGTGARRVGPELDHLGAELVAHHDVARQVDGRHPHALGAHGREHGVGHRHHRLAVTQEVEVGPADPTGQDAHEHLAGLGAGVVGVVDHEPALSHHTRTHRHHPFCPR